MFGIDTTMKPEEICFVETLPKIFVIEQVQPNCNNIQQPYFFLHVSFRSHPKSVKHTPGVCVWGWGWGACWDVIVYTVRKTKYGFTHRASIPGKVWNFANICQNHGKSMEQQEVAEGEACFVKENSNRSSVSFCPEQSMEKVWNLVVQKVFRFCIRQPYVLRELYGMMVNGP